MIHDKFQAYSWYQQVFFGHTHNNQTFSYFSVNTQVLITVCIKIKFFEKVIRHGSESPNGTK